MSALIIFSSSSAKDATEKRTGDKLRVAEDAKSVVQKLTKSDGFADFSPAGGDDQVVWVNRDQVRLVRDMKASK